MKCIKEDKLLLKNNSPEKRNDMVVTYNKIKLVSKVNYSVPNIERCNLGDNFGYRNEKTRLSLPCPCAGCLFGGFSNFSIIITLKHKNHYCLKVRVKNILTRKYLSHGQIGFILREDN